MTLLILLAVIKGYVVIPWWAWVAAWANAAWVVYSFYVVARQEWARRVLAKQGEAFLKTMLEHVGQSQPPSPPMMGMGPKNTVN